MLPVYSCKRCGYKWTPRTEKPVVCPKCKSPYWNKERKKDGRNEREGKNKYKDYKTNRDD